MSSLRPHGSQVHAAVAVPCISVGGGRSCRDSWRPPQSDNFLLRVSCSCPRCRSLFPRRFRSSASLCQLSSDCLQFGCEHHGSRISTAVPPLVHSQSIPKHSFAKIISLLTRSRLDTIYTAAQTLIPSCFHTRARLIALGARTAHNQKREKERLTPRLCPLERETRCLITYNPVDQYLECSTGYPKHIYCFPYLYQLLL